MGESIAEVAEIAAKLTKAQRWFVSSLSSSWTLPSEIGANPNHSSNRDRRLIEASTEGQGREYRLTSLGNAVRNHLISQGADHDR